MADKKISALTGAATPLSGTEVLPVVQSGTTVKVSVSDLTAGRSVYSAAVAGNLAQGTSITPKNVGFITPDSSAYANPSVWNSTIENVATFGLINLNAGSLTASKYQAGVTGIARINGSGTPGASNAAFGVLGTVSNAYGSGVNAYAVGAIGDVYATGNFVVGTAGQGIDFSANTHAAGMTSELLNDYETGTFTPTVDGSSTAGTGTYALQTGAYTRIGDRVFFNLYLSWSAHTGTGNMRVNGLPFTSANNNASYSAISVFLDSATAMSAGNILQMRTILSSTGLLPTQQPTGGGAASQVPLPSSGGFILSGHYYV
jgi:hypothetical protein